MPTSVVICDPSPIGRVGLAGLMSGRDDVEMAAAVSTGRDLVAMCAELAPDVAVVVPDLPGEDGAQVVREAVAASPRTRMVALAAVPDRRRRRLLLAAGLAAELPRDAGPAEVLDAIRTLGAAARGDPGPPPA